jgi:hypothetical protein
MSTSAMIDPGNGVDANFFLRYWRMSSSSVGWNLNPGGKLDCGFFMLI